MRATLKATQGRYKRHHDRRLALRADKLTVGGCAWLRDHAKEEGAGGKLTHVARGPYRVVSTNGPTVLLDVDGEHGQETVAHVFRASGAAVPGPARHPALRTARSFHGAEADGQRYAVDWIADHATLPDGTPTGSGLLDRVPPAYLDGRRGRPARDAARLSAPRRAPGVTPYVRRPAANALKCPGPPCWCRRRRRCPVAPDRPRLTPWVGAEAGCGRGGGVGLFGGALGGCRATGSPGLAVTGLQRHAAAPRRLADTLGTQGESPLLYDKAATA